jgi:hypothetical protein
LQQHIPGASREPGAAGGRMKSGLYQHPSGLDVACHAFADPTLDLAVGEPRNYLWWNVEYLPEVGESYSLKINPANKEVYTQSKPTLGPN